MFAALVREEVVGRELDDRAKKLQGVITDFRRMKAEAASKAVMNVIRTFALLARRYQLNDNGLVLSPILSFSMPNICNAVSSRFAVVPEA